MPFTPKKAPRHAPTKITNRSGLNNGQKMPAPSVGKDIRNPPISGVIRNTIDVFPKHMVLSDRVKLLRSKLENRLREIEISCSSLSYGTEEIVKDILKSPHSRLAPRSHVYKKAIVKKGNTLSDVVEEIIDLAKYIYNNSSTFGKSGVEFTAGLRQTGVLSHSIGTDFNFASIQLLKLEGVYDTKDGVKDSQYDYVNKRDSTGRYKCNTYTHGAEVAFVVSLEGKHEYQVQTEPTGNKTKITSRKTEVQAGAEVYQLGVIPISIIVKQEYDHITGDSVVYIAGNVSGKFGSFFVVDLTAFEGGLKLRIPNKVIK
jgi:hypothetical protein